MAQQGCALDRIAGKLSGIPRERMRARRPRSRVGILHTLNREHPCPHARESGDAPGSALRNHSPLEGESARQGRMPAVEPVGGILPVPMSLPGREEGDGRILGNAALAPHRIGLRHSARPLRLPLKGGVMLEFLERRWAELGNGRHLPGIATLPGNKSRFLRIFAKGSPVNPCSICS